MKAAALLRGLLSSRRPRSVALARPAVIEALAASPGIRVHTLEERWRPSAGSLCLDPPARAFTAAAGSHLVQHLLEVEPPAQVWTAAGLLASSGAWLYEASPANAAAADRVSLASPQLLARLLRRRWNPAAVPPGWWRAATPACRIDRPLLLLSTHANPNYHHWLTLPGLAPLMLQEQFGLDPPPGQALALSHPPGRPLPPFLRPLLELLVPELPLLEGEALTAPTVRLALQEHRSEVVVSPALLAWWRRRCGAVLSAPGGPGRRLFISRRGARSRRCLNEEALHARLAPLGFERLVLEELPLRRQLEAFAAATHVVGVHGAGLTNLVACRPGTTLVELLPADGPFNHYFLMASLLDLRHGHLIGQRPFPGCDDFTVDPERLLALLERCGLEVGP